VLTMRLHANNQCACAQHALCRDTLHQSVVTRVSCDRFFCVFCILCQTCDQNIGTLECMVADPADIL